MKGTVYALAAALLLCAAPLPAPAQRRVPAAEARVERLFEKRDWKGIDAALSERKKLTPRALSLAANALWRQRRYEESLELMRRVGSRYPESVAPYARLMTALALERAGETSDAYAEALRLCTDKKTPATAKYYAMYALARVSRNPDEKEKWLRRMIASASGAGRAAPLYRELIAIGRLTVEDAYELLSAEPRNEAALKLIESAPDTPRKRYRLGYAAYLRGDDTAAAEHLARLKPDMPYGEAGTYFLCLSLERLGRPIRAVRLLEKLAMKKDGDYVTRATKRLARMIGGKAGEPALASLRKLSRSKDGRVASEALCALATSRWDKAAGARDEYLRRFPGGARAAAFRWAIGWRRFLDGKYADALENWGDGATAKLLYWRAKAEDALGRADRAEDLRRRLLTKQALTVYAFIARPGGSLRVGDAPLAEELAKTLAPAPPGELERWGFITYARMSLEGATGTHNRLRRARLSRWLGHEGDAYLDEISVVLPLIKGPTVPRALLEYVYPRPFRRTVETAAQKYGVDPLFIWSIMKQESRFDSNATSRVGAAGLMQLMPATARGVARRMKLKEYDIYGVYDNITMAAHHIAGLQAAWGKPEWVAAAYNAGGGNVKKWNAERGGWEMDAWMESVPFSETNNYVKNVMANYAVYRELYGASGAGKPASGPSEGEDRPAPERDAANGASS